jgi:hypothetical protein
VLLDSIMADHLPLGNQSDNGTIVLIAESAVSNSKVPNVAQPRDVSGIVNDSAAADLNSCTASRRCSFEAANGCRIAALRCAVQIQVLTSTRNPVSSLRLVETSSCSWRKAFLAEWLRDLLVQIKFNAEAKASLSLRRKIERFEIST